LIPELKEFPRGRTAVAAAAAKDEGNNNRNAKAPLIQRCSSANGNRDSQRRSASFKELFEDPVHLQIMSKQT